MCDGDYDGSGGWEAVAAAAAVQSKTPANRFLLLHTKNTHTNVLWAKFFWRMCIRIVVDPMCVSLGLLSVLNTRD